MRVPRWVVFASAISGLVFFAHLAAQNITFGAGPGGTAEPKNIQKAQNGKDVSLSFTIQAVGGETNGADWSVDWGDGDGYDSGTESHGQTVDLTYTYAYGLKYTVTICAYHIDSGNGRCKNASFDIPGDAPPCSAGSTECADCLDNNGNGRADFDGVPQQGWPKDGEHCNAPEDDWEGGPSTPYFHVTITSNWDPANFNWVVVANSGPRYKNPAFQPYQTYTQDGASFYQWRTIQEINGQGNVTLSLIGIPSNMTYTIVNPWKKTTQNYSGRAADSPLDWTIEFDTLPGQGDLSLDLRVNGGQYNTQATALEATPGEAVSFTWTSQNAASCSRSGGTAGWPSATAGTNNSTGVPIVIPANAPIGTVYTYAITCTKTGDAGITATDTTYVRVKDASGNTASVNLTCRDRSGAFSDGPCLVQSGGNVDLAWTGINLAGTCTAVADWSGTKPQTGTGTEGPINTSKTFILNCTGNDGSVVSDGVTVSPSYTACAANKCILVPGSGSNACSDNVDCDGESGGEGSCTAFSGTPDRMVIPPQRTSDLAWTCSQVTNCTISPTVGSVPAEGTAPVTPGETTTYTLRCEDEETGTPVSRDTTVRVFRFEGGVLKEVIPKP